MQKQLDDIKRDQGKIAIQLDQIHKALVGSDLNKNAVIPRLEKVESYQDKDKKQKWMVAGGAAVFGAIVKFWDKIF